MSSSNDAMIAIRAAESGLISVAEARQVVLSSLAILPDSRDSNRDPGDETDAE